MPIKRCSLESGKQGWKWGDSGKCFASRSQAVAQARAAYAAGYRENSKHVALDLLDATQKEFSAPSSGTRGLAGYDLEGQRRKKRRGAKGLTTESLARLLKRTVDTDAREAERNPTRAQAKAGNYKKGKIKISGLDIRIENPAGSTRHGDNWSQFMADHYGYISRTDGSDDDEVDCFVKPGTDDKWHGTVFVVDQVDLLGGFDEHKCMVGYANEREARQAYAANYPSGWTGLGAIHSVPWVAFVAWLKHGDTTEPMAGPKKTISLSALTKHYDDDLRARQIIQEVIDSISESAPFIGPALEHEIQTIVVLPRYVLEAREGEGTMAEFSDNRLQVSLGLEIDQPQAVPNVGIGSNNIGTDARTVIAHELAHALMETMDEMLDDLDMPNWKEVWNKHDTNYWAAAVSHYAARSPHELCGEAFAAYTHPGYQQAKPLPRDLVDQFEALEIKPGMRKVSLVQGLRAVHRVLTSAPNSQEPLDPLPAE